MNTQLINLLLEEKKVLSYFRVFYFYICKKIIHDLSSEKSDPNEISTMLHDKNLDYQNI